MNAKIRAGLTEAKKFLEAAKDATDPVVFRGELQKAVDLVAQIDQHSRATQEAERAQQAVEDAVAAYAAAEKAPK